MENVPQDASSSYGLVLPVSGDCRHLLVSPLFRAPVVCGLSILMHLRRWFSVGSAFFSYCEDENDNFHALHTNLQHVDLVSVLLCG